MLRWLMRRRLRGFGRATFLLHDVFDADFAEGRITAIYIVRNPDKLRHLTPQSPTLGEA